MVEHSVRVLIIDDHALVAAALARALACEQQITISGTVGSLEQLDAYCNQPENRRSCPDVAVIDYQLPDGTGIDAAVLLRQHCPGLRSILVSADSATSNLKEALDAGCVAYLNKASQLDDLIRAIYAAHRGEATFDAATLRAIVSKTATTGQPAETRSLSYRESQILAMLAGGATTEAMASELHLSLHTVRNHVRNLTEKLGAHSRLEAVSIAARSGLLTLVQPPGPRK